LLVLQSTGGLHVDVGFALLADVEPDSESEDVDEDDLSRLERWLTAAETVLSSLRSKPHQLTTFEKSLLLHSVSSLCLFVVHLLSC